MEHHIEEEVYSKTMFGFWVYLMTDCILFATLFAAFAVLHNNTFGGPSGADLFDGPFVLGETMALLVSSFTCGLARLACYRNKPKQIILWLACTFLLGATFLTMELSEFSHLVESGHSWKQSAFLSSFFTLVATHGCHITIGLIWMLVVMGQILFRGIKPANVKRLATLSLFWHFLDVVWIFIFTIVYLMEMS